MDKRYYVYILTNCSHKVLYTGVTNDIARRLQEHRGKMAKGFTAKYNVDTLVYVAVHENAYEAISHEKRIKGGSRAKKLALIHEQNPSWSDLASTL